MTVISDFTGFPEAGLRFLRELETNNNRAWFEEHKSVYQESLLEPALAFVVAVGEALQEISPHIRYDTRVNGSGTLMRIYRDVRFSKDKSPYKTNISGLFWEGAGKKTTCPAFGFQLTGSDMGLMAGIFSFPKPLLAAYREAVLNDQVGSELEAILASLAESGRYVVAGEQSVRVPAGVPADHPRANLLRYKGLWAHPESVDYAQLGRSDLVDICMEHFRTMAPLQVWLATIESSE